MNDDECRQPVVSVLLHRYFAIWKKQQPNPDFQWARCSFVLAPTPRRSCQTIMPICLTECLCSPWILFRIVHGSSNYQAPCVTSRLEICPKNRPKDELRLVHFGAEWECNKRLRRRRRRIPEASQSESFSFVALVSLVGGEGENGNGNGRSSSTSKTDFIPFC